MKWYLFLAAILGSLLMTAFVLGLVILKAWIKS